MEEIGEVETSEVVGTGIEPRTGNPYPIEEYHKRPARVTDIEDEDVILYAQEHESEWVRVQFT